MGMRATNGWRRFRCRIFTICGRARLTGEENLVSEDQAGAGGHWRAAETEPGWSARIPADRQRSSRRSGGDERGVPHQRGGPDDAVASGGSDGADLGSVADSGAGSEAAAVSLSHPRLSFRQRDRVHQSPSGRPVEQVIGSKPNRDGGTPTTMAWRKPRTER